MNTSHNERDELDRHGQINIGDSAVLTANDLARAFRDIGLAPGDNVILHSSFKSLGPVEGGPQCVVDAMMDVISPGGHLMTPTFTYCLPVWNVQPFDIAHTKSRVGAITEAVRLYPGAMRSFHPTHSVAVIGPDAEEIVRNHMRATPIGLDSPFDRMRRRGARILMLGVNQNTNSSLHLCEVAAGMPYVQVAFTPNQNCETAWFFNEQGQIEHTQIYEPPGCSRGFREIEPELRQLGILRDMCVARAESQLLYLPQMADAVIGILRKRQTLLLCGNPDCSICPRRRYYMQRHGI
ncbi:MAG: AAC(3) family N-acetyltransferase [bacterium]|nr:AAC(3) family N-acetyltransferase [Candidatus Sumerlaeota bacterium]